MAEKNNNYIYKIYKIRAKQNKIKIKDIKKIQIR